ncbi:polysaccharide deacetylase family protein [Sphingobium sp. HWE2-09]|uniref:polysaccharide deacetylase family protein n=1 Tax=Sphingobium sp. HWE2-09 TaxID=3108390 RepID=UPI002DCAE496|nr:polysaccharide deacetylase family protein [Sphingobium sp. HWE2-09]
MRSLLVAIHDVGPGFEGEIDGLLDRLTRHVTPQHIAMLVVPNHWGKNLLVTGSAFAARLRGWSDLGISMFVHGWFHKDFSTHNGAIAALKARHMTAGEGEFLGLDKAAAAARIYAGKTLIETITGRPVAGFIAPAWLYGDGAKAALAESGLALAEDHFKIWSPHSGRIVARGPVITWASRSRARIASSLLVARLLPHALRFAPVVRVAVHPGDVHLPALLVSIDNVLRRLCAVRTPMRYEDLLNYPSVAHAYPDLPAQL